MIKIKQLIPELIFLLLFVSTGLVPNYDALDRIATQWLYLSIINTIGLIYILYDRNYNYDSFLKFKPFILLIIFTFWGLLSYVYALNQDEVIIKTIRWIQIPISLFILMNIIQNKSDFFIKITCISVTLILIFELYFTYSTYFQLTQYVKYDFSYAYILKGATGNKNINASSILIKIPFLIYLIDRLKNYLFKYIIALLLILAIYILLIIGSRASILSLFVISSIFIFRYFFFSTKNKALLKNPSALLPLFGIIIPTLFFMLNVERGNTSSITKRVSTINMEDTSTQQRVRFYEHSLDQIIKNPLVGVGLGNWKVKSVDYDKNDISGYTIPYHTHNDFLEIGTELGILGLILYLLVFIFPLLDLLKDKKHEFININTIILFSGIVYFFDANLNFPHARPVMQIPFILILVFAFYKKQKSLNNV